MKFWKYLTRSIKYHRGKYFAWSFQNPFEIWWKARKYFKIPKTIIRFTYKRTPYARVDYHAKILDIYIHDLFWKDKYNSPRHEYNPLIFIYILGLCIWIYPKIYKTNEFGNREDGDIYYWEYLLDYLYYTKTLKLTDVWTSDSKIAKRIVKYGETDEEDKWEYYKLYVPTHLFSLNKTGLKEFKKLYEKH